MPIYEYRCASCGHELEALQKITDAPLTECPACHRADLRKQVSAAGFQLKGSGWYVTDFRNSGAKPAKGDAAKDAAKGNGGGDAKPADGAAKSETTSEATSTKSAGTTDTQKTTTVTPDKAGS